MVLFVMATGFGTKTVSAASNPQLLTADKTKVLDFDSSHYEIISNFKESSTSYGAIDWNETTLEMVEGQDYVVKYPNSLTVGNGTKLTVRVTVRSIAVSMQF